MEGEERGMPVAVEDPNGEEHQDHTKGDGIDDHPLGIELQVLFVARAHTGDAYHQEGHDLAVEHVAVLIYIQLFEPFMDVGEDTTPEIQHSWGDGILKELNNQRHIDDGAKYLVQRLQVFAFFHGRLLLFASVQTYHHDGTDRQRSVLVGALETPRVKAETPSPICLGTLTLGTRPIPATLRIDGQNVAPTLLNGEVDKMPGHIKLEHLSNRGNEILVDQNGCHRRLNLSIAQGSGVFLTVVCRDVCRRSLCSIDGVRVAEGFRPVVVQTDSISFARNLIGVIDVEDDGLRGIAISHTLVKIGHFAIGAIDHARLPGMP